MQRKIKCVDNLTSKLHQHNSTSLSEEEASSLDRFVVYYHPLLRTLPSWDE